MGVFIESIRLYIITFTHFIPVDNFPEVLDIFRTSIPVVDIVGMFPDVTCQKWYDICSDRSPSSTRIHDIESSIWLFHEPRPSRSEIRKCWLRELRHEEIEISPLCIDSIAELFRGDMMGYWSKWLKVECMIPDLCSIIENAPRRSLPDDLFERESFIFSARYELIKVIDIGLMVLTRVIIESLTRDMRRECIEWIWKSWKRESHRFEVKI